MPQWESKREQKKQERDERVQAMHRAHPDLADADKKLNAHALACVQKSLKGDAFGLDEADEIYQSLRAARFKLLQKYGLSEDLYEPQWDCPLCEDRVYVQPGVPCVCQMKERREATYLASGLPEKYRSHHFIDALAEGRPMGNLVLRGYVGRGKTHLSAAIANACIERDLIVVYRRVDDLLELIRVCKFERGLDSEATSRTLDLLYNSDLLILDDFGAEVHTAFAIDELTRLIEERNLRNKSWVINTNPELKEIEHI